MKKMACFPKSSSWDMSPEEERTLGMEGPPMVSDVYHTGDSAFSLILVGLIGLIGHVGMLLGIVSSGGFLYNFILADLFEVGPHIMLFGREPESLFLNYLPLFLVAPSLVYIFNMLMDSSRFADSFQVLMGLELFAVTALSLPSLFISMFGFFFVVANIFILFYTGFSAMLPGHELHGEIAYYMAMPGPLIMLIAMVVPLYLTG